MWGRALRAAALLAAVSAAWTASAAAQSAPAGEPTATPRTDETSDADVTPVDPYERDGAAPEVPPDEARSWEVPPQKGQRPTPVRWVFDKTGRGLRWLVRAGIAPIKGALYLEREYKVRQRVEDLFYNADRSGAILPEVGFFSGLGISLGAQAFHRNLLGDGEAIRFVVLRGGSFDQSVQLEFDVPRIAGSRFYASAFARAEETPDQIFSGVGRAGVIDDVPGTVIDPRDGSFETRFRQRRFLGIASAGARFDWDGRRVAVGPSVIANVRRLETLPPGDRDGRRVSIDEVYDLSELPGFGTPRATVLELSMDVSIDNRDNPGAPSDGWLVEGFAGGAPNVDGFGYGHWGIEGSIFQTVFRERRVVMARFGIEGVLGADSDIPFTDLPRLGGPGTLRGYRNNRFRDKLAALATVEYRYPIHNLVSGLVFVEGGTVGRDVGDLFGGLKDGPRVGVGGGLVVHTLQDFVFRTEIAYGEELRLFITTDPLAAFRGRKKRL